MDVGVCYVYIHMCVHKNIWIQSMCMCTCAYGCRCVMCISCVCTCAHGCKVLCAHMCTREGKAQWAPGIFLCCSPPYFSRQGLSLDLEFTNSAGQAEPRAPGIHLPPLPQGAPEIHPALLPQCCCYRCVLHLFNMGGQDQNSCPHRVYQALCQLSLLPSPSSFIFQLQGMCDQEQKRIR